MMYGFKQNWYRKNSQMKNSVFGLLYIQKYIILTGIPLILIQNIFCAIDVEYNQSLKYILSTF